MAIQSLSVVVPPTKSGLGGCVNSCKPCVSRMHENKYELQLYTGNPYYSLYYKQYSDRLNFAKEKGCNTAVLTGDCEPQQNRDFLSAFGDMNKHISNPFSKIELQTTGTMLDDDYLFFLRHQVGISTISLSIFSFDEVTNNRIILPPSTIYTEKLCRRIKQYRFNLRLSLNFSNQFFLDPKVLFGKCKRLGANQVTLRKLYLSDKECSQNKWIETYAPSVDTEKHLHMVESYIREQGRFLEKLDFGLQKYSVDGMGVVLDDDCMSTEAKENIRYLILRPDAHLYTKWDDSGSLIY